MSKGVERAWDHIKRFTQLRMVKGATLILVGILLDSVKDFVAAHIDTASAWGLQALEAHTVVISLFSLLLLSIGPVLLVGGCLAFLLHRQWGKHADVKWTLERVQNLELVYEKQINHLANLMRQRNQSELDAAMQKLLDSYLPQAVTILPSKHVIRATLLRLDATSSALVPWAHYQMPAESIEKIHYKLSPQGKKTVAVQCYADKKMRLVRIVTGVGRPNICRAEEGSWQDDDATYDDFGRGPEHKLRYESFVVLPITNRENQVVAVLCLDSKESNTFSDIRMIGVLDTIRRVIVPAIQVYIDLSQAHEQSAKDETKYVNDNARSTRSPNQVAAPASREPVRFNSKTSRASTHRGKPNRTTRQPQPQPAQHGNRIASGD